MAETKISKCTCKSEFQDNEYGKQMRVFNMKNSDKSKNEGVCTVCGTKKNIV